MSLHSLCNGVKTKIDLNLIIFLIIKTYFSEFKMSDLNEINAKTFRENADKFNEIENSEEYIQNTKKLFEILLKWCNEESKRGKYKTEYSVYDYSDFDLNHKMNYKLLIELLKEKGLEITKHSYNTLAKIKFRYDTRIEYTIKW